MNEQLPNTFPVRVMVISSLAGIVILVALAFYMRSHHRFSKDALAAENRNDAYILNEVYPEYALRMDPREIFKEMQRQNDDAFRRWESKKREIREKKGLYLYQP